MTSMFEVDPAGYKAQMAEMKPVNVIYELISTFIFSAIIETIYKIKFIKNFFINKFYKI